ncbi:hypothetical protein D3C87_1784970 [compost metagenome]
MQAAAKDFMDIAHREGHMVQPCARLRRLQQKQVVVPAAGVATQEHAAPGITVGHDKAAMLGVEARGGFHVAHEEHDMADVDRAGPLVDGRRLVHARLAGPGVHRAALQLHRLPT